MPPSPNDPIEITVNLRERIIFRPERTSIPVPVEDWDALIERVKACKPSFPFWTATYSVAFGIGFTAALAIIPMYFAQVPLWVLVAYSGVSLCGFVAGIISFIAERAASRRQQSDIDRLVVELERRKSLAVATGGG